MWFCWNTFNQQEFSKWGFCLFFVIVCATRFMWKMTPTGRNWWLTEEVLAASTEPEFAAWQGIVIHLSQLCFSVSLELLAADLDSPQKAPQLLKNKMARKCCILLTIQYQHKMCVHTNQVLTGRYLNTTLKKPDSSLSILLLALLSGLAEKKIKIKNL